VIYSPAQRCLDVLELLADEPEGLALSGIAGRLAIPKSAAHRFLADDPRVAAQRRGVIGWCFGGAWALRQAIAHPDLDAAVIYYGRLETDPARLAKIHAPLLGVFANADKSIPPEAVDAFVAALGQAGRAIELHRYDADHAFANPSGAHYDEAAAADAWSHVRRFLATHLRR
jgi:carboxymethylenebutenolidase